MEYFILISAIVVVLITGLIKIRRSANALIRNHNFINEFRKKFIDFSTPYLQYDRFSSFQQPPSLDWQVYHWLVSHMDKTQGLLGIYGILAQYTSPYRTFQASNYPVIINTIPQIRTGEANRDDLLMCDDMMVRYVGAMNRIIDEQEKRVKNPAMWLQQGVQFYIGLPIRLLNWFGVISDTSFDKIVSSKFFQVLAGLGGLAGFIASVVTILQGWSAIKDLIK